MRLDKFLANSGVGSRKEVKQIIKKGKVCVNGKSVNNPQHIVHEMLDTVTLFGEQIVYEPWIYIMMNKPSGVISATKDQRNQTVVDLLEDWMRDYEPFPVGRLDKDTTGLLLLTNYGQLAHQLLSPKKHVDKKYWVKIDCEMSEAMQEAIAQGITLEDGYTTKPGRLEISSALAGEGYITIQEGKFHQIKRMFQSMQAQVVQLKRLEMGTLKLDNNLKPGEVRLLTKKELEQLRHIKK